MKNSRKFDTGKYLLHERVGDKSIEKRFAEKCESLTFQIYKACRPGRTGLSNQLLREIQEEYEQYYA